MFFFDVQSGNAVLVTPRPLTTLPVKEASMAVKHSTRPAPMRARLESKYVPCPMSGCWLWVGCSMANGYGRIGAGSPNPATILAHRAAYEAYVGPIPDGMQVCHRCDVRACINPAHLFLGTGSDNMQDMQRKGRGQRGENVKFAKLSPADIKAIRNNDHLPAARLAREYGVSTEHVIRILRRKTWKWLQ